MTGKRNQDDTPPLEAAPEGKPGRDPENDFEKNVPPPEAAPGDDEDAGDLFDDVPV